MTLAPTDVDTRFDRTIDRWFRDQLAISPEGATFLGLHDHDGDLSSGGRDAIDEEVAFYRRTIDELSAIDPGELSPERGLDRDLAIHQARLGLYWLTEYEPWAGSSQAAEHIGEALFPLFTRDFAPLADRVESMVARLEKAPAYLAQTRERVTDPVRLWTEIDLESTEQLPGLPRHDRRRGRRRGSRRRRHPAPRGRVRRDEGGARRACDVAPRRGPPPGRGRLEGRTRALRGDGSPAGAGGRWRRDPRGR